MEYAIALVLSNLIVTVVTVLLFFEFINTETDPKMSAFFIILYGIYMLLAVISWTLMNIKEILKGKDNEK